VPFPGNQTRLRAAGLCLALLLAGTARAQSTAPLRLADYATAHPAVTAYTQDFAALADGLPEGWYVTFEAKPAQFGGPPDIRRVKLLPNSDPDPMKNTAWSGLDQVFRNFAGRSLFLLSGGEASLTEQAESTDRALGVRSGNALGESYVPTGGYDTGGAAIGFNLATTGWRLTSVNFNFTVFGALDATGKGYVNEWTLQVSNSPAGTGWVDVGAVPSFGTAPVAGDNKSVSFSFRNRALFDRLTAAGIQLDNAPLVCFRVVTTGKTAAAAGTSASDRFSYALDNFSTGYTSLSDTAFDDPPEVFVAKLPLPATGHYEQNFAVLDEGRLPSGWHLTRTATATSLGTLLTLDSVETRNGTLAANLAYRVAWTNSNGTFKNFANPGTPLKGPWLNDQAQEAFPDRMLGFRASSATGDLGHAFVFWCDATKRENLTLKANVFSTNASERPLDVVVQCSTNGGTVWTTLKTLPGLGRPPTVAEGGMKMVWPVAVALPASANLSPSLHLRIAALTLSPGGNPGTDNTRTAIAIDDFSLTYDVRP
jgi:hypothetical protein